MGSLFSTYRDIEKLFTIEEDIEGYKKLVTSNGNESVPIQRWFRFKEAFSIDLLNKIVSDYKIDFKKVKKILDPFCGVGTTILAAQKLAKEKDNHNIKIYGVEQNPFMHFVSKTKSKWSSYNLNKYEGLYASILDTNLSATPKFKPPLSSLNKMKIFHPWVISKALLIKENISVKKSVEKNLLLLGLASILESISGIRKDGRALRIIPKKKRGKLLDELEKSYENIYEDITAGQNMFETAYTKIILGNGRNLKSNAGNKITLENVDLILYSPPYMNNFDYSEVYKLELWVCGFIKTHEQFRELRLKTMRSHPSIKFGDKINMTNDTDFIEITKILDNIASYLPDDKNYSTRKLIFKYYFDDMYVALKNQFRVLKKGGHTFCVVGNSLHARKQSPTGVTGIPIATDLLIALIADRVGFTVKEIKIARYFNGRVPLNPLLRESILVLQK
jgi:DNA modification methylase